MQAFSKVRIFVGNSKFWKPWSTSFPSGKQVDGSPLVAITKTIAERARLRPRTQVHMIMRMMFKIRIPSTSGLGSDMIVLDNALF